MRLITKIPHPLARRMTCNYKQIGILTSGLNDFPYLPAALSYSGLYGNLAGYSGATVRDLHPVPFTSCEEAHLFIASIRLKK